MFICVFYFIFFPSLSLQACKENICLYAFQIHILKCFVYIASKNTGVCTNSYEKQEQGQIWGGKKTSMKAVIKEPQQYAWLNLNVICNRSVSFCVIFKFVCPQDVVLLQRQDPHIKYISWRMTFCCALFFLFWCCSFSDLCLRFIFQLFKKNKRETDADKVNY